jgi:hypothetical protein
MDRHRHRFGVRHFEVEVKKVAHDNYHAAAYEDAESSQPVRVLTGFPREEDAWTRMSALLQKSYGPIETPASQ